MSADNSMPTDSRTSSSPIACGLELGSIHLLMGGAGGVNHQRLGVTDIGEMADHAKRLDELPAGGTTALDAEADDRARAARQQRLREFVVGVVRQRGMQHPFDRLVRGQGLQHHVGIGDVAVHANAERLDALQQLKRIGRRQARAEVAQALGAGPHDEGGLAELLVEDDAVIAGIGLGQHRELAVTRASRSGRRRR